MIYTYDGSFFGYLSAVFDGWHDGLAQIEDICPREGEGSLFGETRFVPTDNGKAQRILDALLEKCGPKTCHYLYYAFLSDAAGTGLPLLQYLRLAFYYKKEFLYHLSDEPIWTVRQWARRTGNERHKLLGLARFQELSDGLLYCRLRPTCCVVPVMAPHFVRRFPAERWVIHDAGRHFGVYYDTEEAVLVTIPQVLPQPQLSGEEKAIEKAWRDYYRTIAIPARRNEALRRSYMPKKYWPSLIEMK
ncbi:TIGR03915 family putative DNA repair protein [Megasphaera sp.]|uniref:TIGR03915 family putative DNA repair protein n=1 Tax=Megasphaera sp. TaxID=2023260 RepID=UPI003522E5BF